MTIRISTSYLFASFAAFVLSGQVAAQDSAADLVQAALVHGDRPAADAGDDARRMPLEVLAFAGIEEGMDIFEMEAGGGWYTEILSRVVGPAGSVTMQSPPSLDSFVGDEPEQRAARLANVRLSKTNFDELDAADNSMDMVTWILGPHELWFQPDENISLGDPDEAFAEIHRILKPGGVFLAIDHVAAPDTGPEVGGTLHRIRESIITGYAEAAGLTVLRSSSLHLNANDPLDISVFDSSIQGSTSKFVVLFRK
ncbi:MAG: methyltransferase domain-containing protein [Pseudohongiellaceae bacterium]